MGIVKKWGVAFAGLAARVGLSRNPKPSPSGEERSPHRGEGKSSLTPIVPLFLILAACCLSVPSNVWGADDPEIQVDLSGGLETVDSELNGLIGTGVIEGTECEHLAFAAGHQALVWKAVFDAWKQVGKNMAASLQKVAQTLDKDPLDRLFGTIYGLIDSLDDEDPLVGAANAVASGLAGTGVDRGTDLGHDKGVEGARHGLGLGEGENLHGGSIIKEAVKEKSMKYIQKGIDALFPRSARSVTKTYHVIDCGDVTVTLEFQWPTNHKGGLFFSINGDCQCNYPRGQVLQLHKFMVSGVLPVESMDVKLVSTSPSQVIPDYTKLFKDISYAHKIGGTTEQKFKLVFTPKWGKLDFSKVNIYAPCCVNKHRMKHGDGITDGPTGGTSDGPIEHYDPRPVNEKICYDHICAELFRAMQEAHGEVNLRHRTVDAAEKALKDAQREADGQKKVVKDLQDKLQQAQKNLKAYRPATNNDRDNPDAQTRIDQFNKDNQYELNNAVAASKNNLNNAQRKLDRLNKNVADQQDVLKKAQEALQAATDEYNKAYDAFMKCLEGCRKNAAQEGHDFGKIPDPHNMDGVPYHRLESIHNVIGNNPFDPLNPLGGGQVTTPKPTPGCTGVQPASESQTQSCPAGQTGTISQTRAYSCVGRAWMPGAWTTVTNTCITPSPPGCTGSPPVSESQTISCPAGQTGTISQTRAYSCVGSAWTLGAWTTIANTCATPPPPGCTGSAPVSESQTQSCPAGQTGIISQTRAYSCVGSTWTPGAWQTVSNSCTCNPLVQPQPDGQNISCPAGQTGTITQQRAYVCSNGSWVPGTNWVEVARNCTTPPAGCSTFFHTGNYACGGGCGVSGFNVNFAPGSSTMQLGGFGPNPTSTFSCNGTTATSTGSFILFGVPGHTVLFNAAGGGAVSLSGSRPGASCSDSCR